MRRFAFVIGLVLLLSSPGVALASTGDIIDLGPEIAFAGTGREGWVYYAGAPFDSTFPFLTAVCGVDWENDLNTSQRDWLSNESVAFRSLANNPDYCGSMLSLDPFPSLSILDSYWQFWGIHNVYCLGCPADVLDVARVELDQVLRGEVSNLTEDGDYTIFPGQCWLSTSGGLSFSSGGVSYQFAVNPSSGYVGMPDFVDISVPTSLLEQLQAIYPEADTLLVSCYAQNNVLQYNLLAFVGSQADFIYQNNHNIRKLKQIHVDAGVRYASYSFPMGNASYDGTIVCGSSSQRPSMNTSRGSELLYQSPASGVSATVTIPTEPDPDPDPPVQPPDPGTDVPTTDPPTWPTIQLPDIDVDLPSVDIDWPTLAEGLDYTDLLRTIIARLESIGDILGTIDEDLSTHCQHLQRQIHEQAKYLGNLIVQGLHSDLSFLGTQIQSAYKSINSCIREQVGWLASQLQWIVNYDSDFGVLESWLQRIWSKIGKGSYLQPDPVTDEPGFLDWLEKLWEHIIGTLSEITDGALDELLVVLDDLAHRFPFSIPWDVMALLALFAHTPEPIAFTITLPDVPGLYGGVIEVDCSGWDWMAGMVRPVLLVMFAYRLAMWTPKALEGLGLLGEFKRSE